MYQVQVVTSLGPISVTFFWVLKCDDSIWGIISGHGLKKLVVYLFFVGPVKMKKTNQHLPKGAVLKP